MRAAYSGVVIIIISKNGFNGFRDLGQVICKIPDDQVTSC